MNLEQQIVAAVVLDLLVGDPRWLPHPVRLIAGLAQTLEPLARRLFRPRVAGLLTALVVIGSTGITGWVSIRCASRFHPLLGDLFAVIILYTCIAARDLAGHAALVYRRLQAADVAGARRCAALMVGRDTANLDEGDIVRAVVESVAENTVDGVTAPLCFAFLAGPVGAIAYKAASTLDSMFGYKNDRYLHFGWASARVDDLANLLPSRFTAPLIAAAAALLGFRGRDAIRVWLRDGRKHPSPNSGMTEAAMAGALGVELGGPSCYLGQPSHKPKLGNPGVALERVHIRSATSIMLLTTLLALAALLTVRLTALRLLGG